MRYQPFEKKASVIPLAMQRLVRKQKKQIFQARGHTDKVSWEEYVKIMTENQT